jgi:hypothetical protein
VKDVRFSLKLLVVGTIEGTGFGSECWVFDEDWKWRGKRGRFIVGDEAVVDRGSSVE